MNNWKITARQKWQKGDMLIYIYHSSFMGDYAVDVEKKRRVIIHEHFKSIREAVKRANHFMEIY